MWTTEKLLEIAKVIEQIKYKTWTITTRFDSPSPYTIVYLQASFFDDNKTYWTTRKWLLSEHMTVSEIVQTAFKMILTAEEHEVREEFKYKGQAIFGPHFNVERLVQLASEGEEAQETRS